MPPLRQLSHLGALLCPNLGLAARRRQMTLQEQRQSNPAVGAAHCRQMPRLQCQLCCVRCARMRCRKCRQR